jgi:hypothetical protein
MIENSEAKQKYLYLGTIKQIILSSAEKLQFDVDLLVELLF